MEHKINKWKTIESEYIIRRPWLTARRDRVELPDGRIHPEYYVLEYPDWVNVIAETTEGKYILVEQYRHGRGEVGFELPAGCVEPGEEPIEGAKRELLEETGFGGGEWELIATMSPNPSTSANTCYAFVARGVERLNQEQHLDSTEDIAVHEVDRDTLYNMLAGGEIMQAMMVAPLWKYFATKQK